MTHTTTIFRRILRNVGETWIVRARTDYEAVIGLVRQVMA